MLVDEIGNIKAEILRARTSNNGFSRHERNIVLTGLARITDSVTFLAFEEQKREAMKIGRRQGQEEATTKKKKQTTGRRKKQTNTDDQNIKLNSEWKNENEIREIRTSDRRRRSRKHNSRDEGIWNRAHTRRKKNT